MPNNASANKPTTSDELPPLLRVFPRPSKTVDGHILIACICTIPLEDQGEMLCATRRDKPESPWLPAETCACGGTGWVCYNCHSHQWALKIDPEKHRSEAVPCEKCSETKLCAVVWQPWMLAFRDKNAPQRNVRVVPRYDPAVVETERKQREQERAAGMARISDDQVNWEDLYEHAA